MKRSQLVVLIAAVACQGSCQGGEALPGDPGLAESSRPIIGGTPAPGDGAVVAVQVGGLCTGTLVAESVVLTAAHCVADAIDAGATSAGRVRFGDGNDFFATREIADMAMHRRYDNGAFTSFDIALLRLASPAPENVVPIAINRRELTETDIGREVRTVGFGLTEAGNGATAGIKRQVLLTIDELRPHQIGLGSAGRNTCQGDSGGPTFADFGAGEELVAVTSFGSDECRGRSFVSRSDAFYDDFIGPILAAWSGPCPADGVCDAECAAGDADCDPCAFEGQCADGCERPDLDCPLGGLLAAPCDDAFDCESRLCVEAADDPRIRYCSAHCEAVGTSCEPPLTRCEERADAGAVCVFPSVTRGAQGWPCDSGEECRSGLCEAEAGICVELCGAGDVCPESYECLEIDSRRVCGLPGEGGCGVAGAAGLGAALALLGLGWPMGHARRRRRRRLASSRRDH